MVKKTSLHLKKTHEISMDDKNKFYELKQVPLIPLKLLPP